MLLKSKLLALDYKRKILSSLIYLKFSAYNQLNLG
jgi:hypothetical protein